MSRSTRFSKTSVDDYSKSETNAYADDGDNAEDQLDLMGCCAYFIFLMSFIAMVLVGGEPSPDAFWSSTSLKYQIVSFTRIVDNRTQIMDWDDLNEAARFWTYMVQVLLDEVYVDENYNDVALPDVDKHHFGMHLVLMGGFRLRQYRVKAEECKYRDQAFLCYTNEEDKETMTSDDYEDIPWTSTSENDETPYYRGEHGYYPGSGFVVKLTRNHTEATAIVEGLKKGLWIDGQTRMVSIDWNNFNPTTGMHTVSRIVFEFGHSGAVIPTKSIRTWRFLRYERNRAAMVCDIVFAVFVLLAIITELREFYGFNRQGNSWGYFSFWNMIDMVCLTGNLCIGLMNFIIYWEVKHEDLIHPDVFISLVHS